MPAPGMGRSPKLKEFNPGDLRPDANVGVFGVRRSGKTTWLMFMLSFIWPRFDNMYAFTETKFKGYFKNIMPQDNIFEGYQDELMGNILLKAKTIAVLEVLLNIDLDYRIGVIFDDVFSDRTQMRNSKYLDMVATMGRHFGVFSILCTQHYTNLSPVQRENLDNAVVFKTVSRHSLNVMFEQFAGTLDRDDFDAMMDKYTENQGAIVVDTVSRNPDPRKTFFWSMADPKPPKFFIADSDLEFVKELEKAAARLKQ